MSQKPVDYYMVEDHITFDNAEKVRAQVEYFIKQSRQSCTIDFRDLKHTKSVVLSLLMCWVRFAAGCDVKLSFANVTDKMQSLIEVCGLQDVLSAKLDHSSFSSKPAKED